MPGQTAIDFHNPFVSAAILDPRTGERYPLWTDVSEAALQRAKVPSALQSLCFLTAVTVEMSLGPVPNLSATLSPPIDMAKHLLDSELIEYGVALLQVQFGYASGTGGGGPLLSPIYEGILMEPDVTFGGDASITLNAQGVGGMSATRQKSKRVWKTNTRLEILRAIAGGPNASMQRELEIDDSKILQRRGATLSVGDALRGASSFAATAAALRDVAAQTIVTDEYKLLNEVRPYAQGFKTDWWAMQQLIRECRCTSYLLGNNLVLIPINLTLSAPPTRRLVWFDHPNGEIDPAKGVWPILSFSTQTKAVFLPGALRGLAMAHVDSETREPVKAFINDLQAKTGRTNNGVAAPAESKTNPAANLDTGDGGDQINGSPTDPLAVQQAISAYDAFTMNMGIQLTVETLVDPLLLPGDVYEIKGVGKRLEGNYAVLSATFNLGENNSMSLELVSNVGQLVAATRSQGFNYPEPEGAVGPPAADIAAEGGVDHGPPGNPT